MGIIINDDYYLFTLATNIIFQYSAAIIIIFNLLLWFISWIHVYYANNNKNYIYKKIIFV